MLVHASLVEWVGVADVGARVVGWVRVWQTSMRV